VATAARPSYGPSTAAAWRSRYLRREHGEPALAVMRAIKTAFDPHNIMNLGKIIMLG
jgi:D-lactate dehydrogenase (cytochrome)